MMNDGDVAYYQIEHRHPNATQAHYRDRWATSDLGHFLFANLTRDQATGNVGRRYRALLEPQTANSALWQKYGIHGFEDEDDALRVLQELRALPDEDAEFRLVLRRQIQTTEAMA